MSSTDQLTISSSAGIDLTSTGNINSDSGANINLHTTLGQIRIGDVNGLGSLYVFRVDSGLRYLTSNGGRMANHTEITTPGTKVDIWENFITIDVDVVLQPYTAYVNPLNVNDAGWFCYIQNIHTASVTISSADSIQFVGDGSIISSPYTLNPHTTARFTLTFYGGSHYWSVLVG